MKKSSFVALLCMCAAMFMSCNKEQPPGAITEDADYLLNSAIEAKISARPFTGDAMVAYESTLMQQKVEALVRLGKRHPELYKMSEDQLRTVFNYHPKNLMPANSASRLPTPACDKAFTNNMDLCDYAMYFHTALTLFAGGAASLVTAGLASGTIVVGLSTTLMIHSACVKEAQKEYADCNHPPVQ